VRAFMAKFVAVMDIDVLGCYSVKPRRSPYQRIHGIEPQDRKAFRLCIPREDSARLLDPKKWPAHICVSHWIFKKKNSVRVVCIFLHCFFKFLVFEAAILMQIKVYIKRNRARAAVVNLRAGRSAKWKRPLVG